MADTAPAPMEEAATAPPAQPQQEETTPQQEEEAGEQQQGQEQQGEGDEGGEDGEDSAAKGPVEFEPPASSVYKIIKRAVGDSVQVGKEAKATFTRAAGIFILYLTACANDFCREGRRTTISANDVYQALRELDFDEFVEPLQGFLANYNEAKKTQKDNKAAEKKEGDGDGEGGEMAEAEAEPDEEEQASEPAAAAMEQDALAAAVAAVAEEAN